VLLQQALLLLVLVLVLSSSAVAAPSQACVFSLPLSLLERAMRLVRPELQSSRTQQHYGHH
jgi:hypothetical protein